MKGRGGRLGCWWGVAQIGVLTALGVWLWPAVPFVAVLSTSTLVSLASGYGVAQYRFWKRGYFVTGYGRDGILYKERAEGSIRSLIIEGELMGRGPRLIYFPGDEEWQRKMPPWARD
jgi:hypothetical protein